MSDRAIIVKDEAGVFVSLEPSQTYPGRHVLTVGVKDNHDRRAYSSAVVGEETLLQLYNHIEYLLCDGKSVRVASDKTNQEWSPEVTIEVMDPKLYKGWRALLEGTTDADHN